MKPEPGDRTTFVSYQVCKKMTDCGGHWSVFGGRGSVVGGRWPVLEVGSQWSVVGEKTFT